LTKKDAPKSVPMGIGGGKTGGWIQQIRGQRREKLVLRRGKEKELAYAPRAPIKEDSMEILLRGKRSPFWSP